MMQQYDVRIKLKSDIETEWDRIASSFKPLAGEMIIYSADSSHSYCRVKIGDGENVLADLDFIDAGTINGHAVEIVKLANFDSRPSPGSPDKLYVDMTNNRIYHYDGASGYTQLSNFTLDVSKADMSKISSWSPGVLTSAAINNNVLQITNGQLPYLSYYNTQAVTGVQSVASQQG